jgi:hypothetical protein
MAFLSAKFATTRVVPNGLPVSGESVYCTMFGHLKSLIYYFLVHLVAASSISSTTHTARAKDSNPYERSYLSSFEPIFNGGSLIRVAINRHDWVLHDCVQNLRKDRESKGKRDADENEPQSKTSRRIEFLPAPKQNTTRANELDRRSELELCFLHQRHLIVLIEPRTRRTTMTTKTRRMTMTRTYAPSRRTIVELHLAALLGLIVSTLRKINRMKRSDWK